MIRRRRADRSLPSPHARQVAPNWPRLAGYLPVFMMKSKLNHPDRVPSTATGTREGADIDLALVRLSPASTSKSTASKASASPSKASATSEPSRTSATREAIVHDIVEDRSELVGQPEEEAVPPVRSILPDPG